MTKNHLKRINAPKTWPISRKETTFTLRPNPGGHAMTQSMPLSILFRDALGIARTMRSIKTLLNTQEVLVNGKRRMRPEDTAGLMDVVSFPAIKTSYRILIDRRNTLKAVPVAGDEAGLIPSKVTSKTKVRGGKLQIGCHNGRTLLMEKGAPVIGSTLMLTPDNKTKEVFPLEKGASVLITGGKHVGQHGTLKALENGSATIKLADGEIMTGTEFVFVIGKAKPAIKVD